VSCEPVDANDSRGGGSYCCRCNAWFAPGATCRKCGGVSHRSRRDEAHQREGGPQGPIPGAATAVIRGGSGVDSLLEGLDPETKKGRRGRQVTDNKRHRVDRLGRKSGVETKNA
jgi:ribosomal protein L40E